MAPITIHGQQNMAAPAFYMPNRLSVQACKALHYLLRGKLCYMTDPLFPPPTEVEQWITRKGVPIEHFDFRNGTPQAAKLWIRNRLRQDKSVIFLPGKLSKVRGSLTDVPKLFLDYVQEMRLPVCPLFLGYYGSTRDNLYRDVAESGCREEFYILPGIPVGMHMGEKVYAAWMEQGMEAFSTRDYLQGSVTTHLVSALRKHGSVEMIDGLSQKAVPYYKILGVAMGVARRLVKTEGERIGVILPPGPGGTIALLACMLARKTPVMINYASSGKAFESTVQQAEIRTFITARPFMKKLPNFSWPPEEQILFVEELIKSIPKLLLLRDVLLARTAPTSLLCRMYHTDARSGEDEAVMLFTAGSTGEPKGVTLTHRMLLANVAQSCCRLSLDRERVLGSLPLFHSFGLTIALILPLLKGRPICTYPNPTDARTLCQLIEKYKLTMLCATPTFARTMLRRAEAYTFASVRYFIVGAERLQPDLEREFLTRCGVQLLEGYGLTEAAPVCSVNLPDEPTTPGSAFTIPGTVPRSIGSLLPGIAIRITDVDDDSRQLPLTERGMIWLKGPNLFRGYVKRPQLNADVLRDGWFRSGDIGQMDLNGFVTLGGRLSRFSKIGGEMVPHEGVEEAVNKILRLETDDSIKIAVTGVLDEQKGEVIVLLSSLPEHADPAAQRETLSLLRTEMTAMGYPNLWVPRFLIPVDQIPLLASGKQDLHLCRRLAYEYLEIDRDA